MRSAAFDVGTGLREATLVLRNYTFRYRGTRAVLNRARREEIGVKVSAWIAGLLGVEKTAFESCLQQCNDQRTAEHISHGTKLPVAELVELIELDREDGLRRLEASDEQS